SELGNPSTAEGHYAISIPVTSATGYTIRATAIGAQLSDSEGGTICSPLELVVSAGGETKTPADCW
ncbi:type IV pilin protein, partial [Kaarinaea lacus]